MKKFRDMTDAELMAILDVMIDTTINDSRDAEELKEMINEWNNGRIDPKRWPELIQLVQEENNK